MLLVTNKMQPNTIFFITVKALHVSGGFPRPSSGAQNCTCNMWYLLSLVAAAAAIYKGVSRLEDITAGGDFLGICDQNFI
jgi:hypothetical protein